MDTFTFTLQTGTVDVHFTRSITIPAVPTSGGIYVADSNTVALLKTAEGFDPSVPLIVVPAGEEHKTLANIELILEKAIESALARDSVFIGFGGGVITDMTAFAASLYMRGAKLELVATSLLAMADAAVGGKTGVDFKNYKNCIGSFYPAQRIHMPIEALLSLPQSEYRSGLAEVLKTALLYAPKLYQIMCDKKEEILNRDPDLLTEIVKRCVQAKARVVERDLYEKGERMYLNLGHTFGHALESVAGFGAIAHGDAVAWGISRALELGCRLHITDSDYRNEVMTVLSEYGWETTAIHSVLHNTMEADQIPAALLHAMKNDKKKRDGVVRFVLQREINSTLVTEVPDEEVLAVLR